MTRKIEVEFLRPVPSGTALRIEGRVLASQGRKHSTEAVIFDAEGTELARGKGLFIAIQSKEEKK